LAEFQVKVENVVAFTSLGKKIPLLEISDKFEDAEYAPESFPGVVYRVKDPRAATLIFSSGKIVCTGAKSIEKAKEAMHKVVDDIRRLGIRLPTKFNITVENIVASTQIEVPSKSTINLEEISFSLENVEYEPEQFPGLVCRITEPRVAFLVFGSGKIICTGARKIDDIHTALGKLKEKLEAVGVKVKPAKWLDKIKAKENAKEEEPQEPAPKKVAAKKRHAKPPKKPNISKKPKPRPRKKTTKRKTAKPARKKPKAKKTLKRRKRR